MTVFDRIESRMPELMSELAQASVPDYFDDMLRQTGRARQRPVWASLERWLPMDVVARPVRIQAPSMRPFVVFLVILAFVAAGILFAGSLRTRLPEPYGPARNGAIVISTDNKNIVTIDPATGEQVALIEAPTDDVAPWFSPDGRRMLFVRQVPPGLGSFWLANADGSGAHEVVRKPVDWAEWAGDSSRIVATRLLGGPTETTIVNVDDGTSTILDVGLKIDHPLWRPGNDQIVFSVPTEDPHRAYYLLDADGTDLHRIEGVADSAIHDPALSPDGSKLAYATWGSGDGTGEDIHVLDIVTGGRTVVTPVDEFLYEDVRFSPDGTRLLGKRSRPDGSYQLAIIPADGSGKVMPIGPEQPHNPAADFHHAQFSPDGAQVLVYYGADASTWLLESDGFGAQQLPVSAREGATWQRLAP